MLTTILSLLGGGLGGLLRFIPEILKLWTAAKDQAHEYKMTELQLKIDQARASQAIDLVHAQGDVAAQAGELQAYITALEEQSKKTGVAWADALSASVRPVVTYWWMALFTLYKLVLIVAATVEFYIALKAVKSLLDLSPALSVYADRLWSPQDAGILSMILGFWFVDRVILKGGR